MLGTVTVVNNNATPEGFPNDEFHETIMGPDPKPTESQESLPLNFNGHWIKTIVCNVKRMHKFFMIWKSWILLYQLLYAGAVWTPFSLYSTSVKA